MATTNTRPSETAPLLGAQGNGHDIEQQQNSSCDANPKKRGVVWGLLTLLFAAALILMLGFEDKVADTFGPWLGLLPHDPALAALYILDNAPIIVSFVFILVSCCDVRVFSDCCGALLECYTGRTYRCVYQNGLETIACANPWHLRIQTYPSSFVLNTAIMSLLWTWRSPCLATLIFPAFEKAKWGHSFGECMCIVRTQRTR